MHINIQSVSIDDITTIHEIEKRCFPYDYWNEKSFEYAVNSMNDDSYRYIFLKAITDDGSIVGYIIATVVADDCEIQNIAVDIQYRRHHVGQELLNQLGNEIYGLANNIYLEVRYSNLSAQRLYEKLGFEVVGVRKNYYDYPREDAILMMKNIE